VNKDRSAAESLKTFASIKYPTPGSASANPNVDELSPDRAFQANLEDFLSSLDGDSLLRLAMDDEAENGTLKTPAINTSLPNTTTQLSLNDSVFSGEASTAAVQLMKSFLPRQAATPGSQEQSWLDAIKNNNLPRAKELFERGVSPLTCDNVGLAALDYACILDHPKLMPFLVEAIGHYLTRRLCESLTTKIFLAVEFSNIPIPRDRLLSIVVRAIKANLAVRLSVQQLQLAMRVTHPHVLLPALQQSLDELDLHSVLLHIQRQAEMRVRAKERLAAATAASSSLSIDQPSVQLPLKQAEETKLMPSPQEECVMTTGSPQPTSSNSVSAFADIAPQHLSLQVSNDDSSDAMNVAPSALSASPFASMFHTPVTAAAASTFEQPASLIVCASRAQDHFLAKSRRLSRSSSMQIPTLPDISAMMQGRPPVACPVSSDETMRQAADSGDITDDSDTSSPTDLKTASLYLPTAALHPKGLPFVPPPALVRTMSHILTPSDDVTPRNYYHLSRSETKCPITTSSGSNEQGGAKSGTLLHINDDTATTMPDEPIQPSRMLSRKTLPTSREGDVVSPMGISQSVLFALPLSMIKQPLPPPSTKAMTLGGDSEIVEQKEVDNQEALSPTSEMYRLSALKSPPPLFSHYAQPLKGPKSNTSARPSVSQPPLPVQPTLFSDSDIHLFSPRRESKSTISPRSAAFAEAYPFGIADTRGMHLELLAAYLNLARYKHWTALTLTACCGGLEVTRILLATGLMNVEKLGGCGYSALCCAIKCAIRAEKAIAQQNPPPASPPPESTNRGLDADTPTNNISRVTRVNTSPDGPKPPLAYSPKLPPEDPNMVLRRRAWGVVSLLLQYGARPKILKKFLPLSKMGRAAVQEGLTQRLLPLCDLMVELLTQDTGDSELSDVGSESDCEGEVAAVASAREDEDDAKQSDHTSVTLSSHSVISSQSTSPSIATTSASLSAAAPSTVASLTSDACTPERMSELLSPAGGALLSPVSPRLTRLNKLSSDFASLGKLSGTNKQPGGMVDTTTSCRSSKSSKRCLKPCQLPRALLELIAEYAVVPHIDDVNFTTGKLYSEGSYEDLEDDHDTPGLFKALLPCNPTCTCHCHCRFCSDP